MPSLCAHVMSYMHGTCVSLYSHIFYLELGVLRVRVLIAGGVCPVPDLAITVIEYTVLSLKPLSSHEGVSQTEMMASSTPADFAENS